MVRCPPTWIERRRRVAPRGVAGASRWTSREAPVAGGRRLRCAARAALAAYLVSALLLAAPVPPAQARVAATVVSSSLNVRDGPGGAVIDWLPRGAEVSVTAVEGDWARITWMDEPGHVRGGWVALHYLRRGTAAAAGGERFTTTRGVTFSVDIDDVALACRERGGEFDACGVTVRFAVRSDGDQGRGTAVRIGCRVRLRGETAAGSAILDSGSRSSAVAMSSQTVSGKIDLDFDFEPRPIDVVVDDAACRVLAVH